MIKFSLVSEGGSNLISSTFIRAHLLQECIELKGGLEKGGILRELDGKKKSVINSIQCKELLVDFCRFNFSSQPNNDLYNLISLIVGCIDSIHYKIVVEK